MVLELAGETGRMIRIDVCDSVGGIMCADYVFETSLQH